MSDHTKNIPIIGGGATSSTLLIYLAYKAQKTNTNLTGTHFHLIDPKGFDHGGIAYGQAHPKHKLNSTRDEMSPWDPADYNQWCTDNGLGNDIQEFNRRVDNAPFLAEKLAWAKSVLQNHGATFTEHLEQADIQHNGDNFDIVDQNGSVIVSNVPAENINLTVGYGGNENFQNLWSQSGKGYIHNPYYHDQISDIATKTDKPRIACVGTGPALYDFANAYNGDLDKTELTIFSRSARLLETRDVSVEPHEQSVHADYLSNSAYVPQTLDDLKDKIQQDFADAAQTGERSPRRVALDVMKHIKPLLERVTIDLAKEFRCSDLHSWLTHTATPVPDESQKRLADFKPDLVRARLNGNVEALDDGTFKIAIEDQEPIIVDYIINGTGHGRTNQPIIQSLIGIGAAEINERLGTLSTQDTDYKLKGSGINCIGPATHFGIDGMESFAVYADALADEIIAKQSEGMLHNSPANNRRAEDYAIAV